jgi:hypothetical protein
MQTKAIVFPTPTQGYPKAIQQRREQRQGRWQERAHFYKVFQQQEAFFYSFVV